MPVTIRPATADDQWIIRKMVRGARINPRDLRWQRFVMAEHEGGIVGVAQVRVHAGGSRELASLVVLPAFQGSGIAGRLIDALLTKESGPVFMLVDERYADHYRRWDFERIAPRDLPAEMARQYRIGRVFTRIGSLLVRRRIRIVALERAAAAGKP